MHATSNERSGDDTDFDPHERERELLSQAESWDTSAPVDAQPGDIPVVDVGPWFRTGDPNELELVAATLRHACEQVGFFQLVGHDVSDELIDEIFAATRAFHALPLDTKQQINIDNPDHPLTGVGYLPIGERRLPRRTKGNRNEAFLAKSDRAIDWNDNQWLADGDLPGFRATVERYGQAVHDLALRLVPVYAVALGLAPGFFDQAFEGPFWRLRLTHYPPDEVSADDEYGIAPHVDTTFFTLLLQDSPGLRIFSAELQRWINAPFIENAFVVNSGELLRQWSNDRFLSARHFAINDAARSRYSIPLFFNANSDYPMTCLPTCHDVANPPRYPAISYNQSQAVAQGE